MLNILSLSTFIHFVSCFQHDTLAGISQGRGSFTFLQGSSRLMVQNRQSAEIGSQRVLTLEASHIYCLLSVVYLFMNLSPCL